MQWNTLFQKEIKENWHNKKWIWVPLVLILITVMDPLTYYYLPQIIDIVGGVPDGAVFDIPEMVPEEVIMMSLGQLSMFGVIIIALISMGTIAGERRRGVAEIILVKPVSYVHYITSKWTVYVVLTVGSLFIGMFVSWYYINILFGDLAFFTLLKIVGFYGLWLVFVLTLNVFYNTIFKTPGLIGAMTIITIVIMSVFNMIFGHKLTWFPNNLSNHIQQMILTEKVSSNLIGTSAIIGALIIMLLIASIVIFNKAEKHA